MQKFTVRDFNRLFPDEDACLDAIRDLIYPDGISCRKCGEVTKHHRLSGRKAYSCDACGTHVYPLAGTIFEKSSTPLKSWLYAIYLMASTRTGISAKQLERELGVTYKTAWRMFKQVRTLLDDNDGQPVAGTLEVDETFVGGKAKNMHASVRAKRIKGRGHTGKTAVMGIVNRDSGAVIARVVPNVKPGTLLPIIREKVMPASMVYSDEAAAYNQLPGMGYRHERVHHEAKVYVVGDAHTNTMEGFWSLVKRGIGGVYHAVGANYLQSYVNEYGFRYTHRKDEQPMFETFVGRIHSVRTGSHGTYAPLG